MKKRLEAELISIAHRVLKLKNRSETIQLQQEAKKLYEQLTILRFYEENVNVVSKEISADEMENKLFAVEKSDDKEQAAIASTVVEKVETQEALTEDDEVEIQKEPLEDELLQQDISTPKVHIEKDTEQESSTNEELASTEYINKIVAEMTQAKTQKEQQEVVTNESEFHKKEDVEQKITSNVDVLKPKQVSFDELLQHAYTEPDFVKVDEVKTAIENQQETLFENVIETVKQPKEDVEEIILDTNVIENEITEETKIEESRPVEEDLSFKKEMVLDLKKATKEDDKIISLNDKLNKAIIFGLNDRIGFEKKLFNGSTDDFNRVVSQLNTLDSFEEAKAFIENFVKPDYNNWEGKEEFETRFLEIVEKKFN